MLTLAEIIDDFRTFYDLPEGDSLDVYSVDPAGNSPLHLMAVMGDARAIQLLLAAGAQLDLPNGIGNTPLHLAAYARHAAVVTCLLAAGAKAQLRNDAGQSAADVAVEQQHAPMVEIFEALKEGQVPTLAEATMAAARELQLSRGLDAAYLYLPGHPGPGEVGVSARQVALHSLIANYQGPELFLDIDAQGRAIGIEILTG